MSGFFLFVIFTLNFSLFTYLFVLPGNQKEKSPHQLFLFVLFTHLSSFLTLLFVTPATFSRQKLKEKRKETLLRIVDFLYSSLFSHRFSLFSLSQIQNKLRNGNIAQQSTIHEYTDTRILCGQGVIIESNPDYDTRTGVFLPEKPVTAHLRGLSAVKMRFLFRQKTCTEHTASVSVPPIDKRKDVNV